MRVAVRFVVFVALAVLASGCVVRVRDDTLPGRLAPPGPYLGQTPPDSGAAPFAPGVVSTGLYERDLAATPEGDEIYWTVVLGNFTNAAVVGSRLTEAGWTDPEVMPFAADPRVKTIEPFITPDGSRFLFVSDRSHEPGGPAREDEDIWVMERDGEQWGEPRPLPAPVNTEASEFFPSVTRDGTIYFTREGDGVENGIYRSRWVDGSYTEPEFLPPEVNAGRARFNAYVAPDESYLIVPVFGLPDSRGATDYYVVFRNDDDTWTEPVNLGDRVNSDGRQEYSPSVTPDGRYFFFMAARPADPDDLPARMSLDWFRRENEAPTNGQPNVYWMDAGFLNELRPR
jgi:hypothetical protein